MKQDHYAVLGVARDATHRQVMSAYRKLARKYHPDNNDAPEAAEIFDKVVKAKKVLSDPVKRRAFDEETQPTKAEQETSTSEGTARDNWRYDFAADNNYRRDDAWDAEPTDEQYAEVFEDEGVYDEPDYTNDLADGKSPSLARHALTQGFWCLFWFGLAVGCFFAPHMVTKPFQAASNRGEAIAPLGAGVLALVLYVASGVCALVGIAQLFKPWSRD